MGLVFLGAGFILIGIVAWLILPHNAQSAGQEISAVPVEVNFPAPELALKDLQGNPTSLASYRGKVVLVNNWATWCPPCKAEMPTLEAYYQAHQEQNFILIGIEAGEPANQVAQFVQSYQLSFPIWLDPDGKATDAFQNTALPSSYVLDETGAVRLFWDGAISRQMLEKYLTPLLEE
jgi:thiol-disulfide isomerase/thioredoxin